MMLKGAGCEEPPSPPLLGCGHAVVGDAPLLASAPALAEVEAPGGAANLHAWRAELRGLRAALAITPAE